jgi:Ca-activated chloride channel family protein
MRRCFAVMFGLLLGMVEVGANAQGVLIVVDPGHPVPLPRPIPRPEPPPASYRVKELNVQAKISSQVARVQVSQSFVNTGSRQMEVQFVFPLPYDGAVDQLTLMVDGTEYPAKLLPADEARRIYESIVRRNRDPALLEWMGTGMFQTSVFPVPPGAERKVTLAYTQLLRQSQRLTDFLFPLSTAKYTSQAVEKIEFRVTIETTQDLKSVYSPTHPIEIERPDGRHAVVKYAGQQTIPTSDFRLFYDVSEGPVGTSVVAYRPQDGEDGYFLLLAAPQIKAPDEARVAKNIVFVLDRSGSMEGKKIEQAREALTFVLNNLRDGDRFNIVAYDTSVEAFRPELQTYSNDTRSAALGFVNGIYAGGGTNIDGALKAAMTQFQGAEGPTYLLFLTDGLPTVGETNEGKIVAASKQANPGKVRVISFGVGYDVNSRLLDHLTREHRGQSEYVRPDENLEVHVSRLFKKISAPVMTDVTVAFDFDEPRATEAGAAINRVYPRVVPDVFEGEQLVLVGRYSAFGRAKVTISGMVGGQKQSFDFPAEMVKLNSDPSLGFTEKLWAMRRIGEIIDELDLSGRNDELIRELVALSTKHGIMTPYTSFMADDTTRSFDAAANFRRADEALGRLREAEGRGGFSQRAQKGALQNADRALGSNAYEFSGGAAPAAAGLSLARDIDSDREVALEGLKVLGNQSVYRRSGKVWVTPETAEIDLERDKAQIREVERFSAEYFALVAANSPVENQLLSSQQEDEELLVRLRGQVYHLK